MVPAPQQAKDRQKKKSGTKGIRIDAEGGASLEDLSNPELQDNESEPHDPDKARSSNKKVIISMVPLNLCELALTMLMKFGTKFLMKLLIFSVT